MTVNEIIQAAVEPIVPICVWNVYRGPAAEYTTFNFSTLADEFGDDEPEAVRYLIQLHYKCPTGRDPSATRRSLCRAMAAAGCTYPSVIDASDKEMVHLVLECEYGDGDV